MSIRTLSSRSTDPRDTTTFAVTTFAVTTFAVTTFAVNPLFLVYLPWIALHVGVKPFRRGFYCGDKSLMHPFKESTVPGTAVMVLGICINAVAIAIFEPISLHRDKVKMTPLHGYQLGRYNVRQEIVNFCNIFLVFLFGAAIQQTSVNIGKFTTGRLRPHFLAACKPNYTAFSCVDDFHQPQYVTEDVCTAEEEYKTLDMRLSFPSGHSSMSAYCVVFIMMYLEARMTYRRLHLIKAFLQAVALWLALGVCLSRISDYKHHWSDVLAGALLGGSVAVFVVRYVLRLYPPSTLHLPAQLIDEVSALSTIVTHSQKYRAIRDDKDNKISLATCATLKLPPQ
ncbi:putative phosphatidate phosphatase [Lamellibrachia satsuma]|nr:putative phosphatidate phosphatase [Lamellibrachia satsuma]